MTEKEFEVVLRFMGLPMVTGVLLVLDMIFFGFYQGVLIATITYFAVMDQEMDMTNITPVNEDKKKEKEAVNTQSNN